MPCGNSSVLALLLAEDKDVRSYMRIEKLFTNQFIISMKKNLFLSGMALCVMSSCSNDSIPGASDSEAEGLVPVTIGLNMASANVNESRGTGTVGGTTDETNVWRYENLYVLMTTGDKAALENQDATWGFTSVRGTVLKEQFNNTFYARPVANEKGGWSIDYQCDPNEGKNLKYYPASGRSDFFAYYVDNAAKLDAKNNPVIAMEDEAISVAYTIDGSQDLLMGKADVSATGGENGFSAKTAREGKIPNIRMQHMLTRLTFTLKNGNMNTANITVKSISVESKNSGKMYVAYKSEPTQKMVWNEDKAELFLKQAREEGDEGYFVSSLERGKCPLMNLKPIKLDGVNDVNVGEALFVCPGETSYTMNIVLEHNIMVNGKPTVQPVTVTLDLVLGGKVAFEAGKSYHINATIYGLEEIKLDAELEKWAEYSEDIEVGRDDI